MPAEGIVDPIDDHSCRLRLGAESISATALALGRLGVGFTVQHPPALVTEVRTLADRYARAAPGGGATDPTRRTLGAGSAGNREHDPRTRAAGASPTV